MDQKEDPELILVGARVAPEIAERFETLAQHHGRTRADEVRMALAVFDTQATLHYLQTPQAKIELSPKELEAAKKRVASDLEDIMKAAFIRPSIFGSDPTLN